jgi:hypothetical protein
MRLRSLLLLALFAAPARAQSPDPDAPFRLAVESWVARHRRPGVSFVHVLGGRATGGMAHPSVEVRAACGRMAVALYECKHCHGTHICPVVAENEASGYTRLCDECGGLWDHCRRCR